MPLIAVKIFVGFLVGTLIGMTGLGGGVLLLPILIFGLRIPPIIAVGSDALFNFFTKIPAGWVHLHKGTVRRKVVVALAMGSVPGSILGVALLTHIRSLYGSGVNDFIKSAVGLLLVVIPTLLLFQSRIEDNLANRPPTLNSFAGMTAIGLTAGFLVGISAYHSGHLDPVQQTRVFLFENYFLLPFFVALLAFLVAAWLYQSTERIAKGEEFGMHGQRLKVLWAPLSCLNGLQ